MKQERAKQGVQFHIAAQTNICSVKKVMDHRLLTSLTQEPLGGFL